MATDKYLKTTTHTLGTASGSQSVTHTLVSQGGAAVPHKVIILPRSDPGTAFRWWISALNSTTYTFNWAGANAGVQIDVTAQIIHSIVGGPSSVTGW